jgi:hypothetical protein
MGKIEGEAMNDDEKKEVIKKKYGEIAMSGGSCCAGQFMLWKLQPH